MRLASWLLKAGILVPVCYYGVLIAGGLTWPGYNHMTQYASELGSAAAPMPRIFNSGIIAAGVCALIGGLGMFLALRKLGSGLILPTLTAIALGLWGVAMIMGGLHPMPDPLHNGYQMGLAVLVAPVFLFLSLADRSDVSGLKTFLILTVLVSAGLFAVMMNIGDMNLVRRSNVGLWQRAFSLASIPWIGIASLCVDQRLAAKLKKGQ